MTIVQPTLTIIAGPNGSGKSTLTRSIQESLDTPLIDPDAEARKIRPEAPELASVAGGKQAIKLARNYVNNNQSFVVETTLSGNTYLKMMRDVKQKGWQINLIYIGIDNVEVNIDRVAQRVAQGGHNVPIEDIRRRYKRSLENLPIALQLADNASIYDNSTAVGHQNLLSIEDGRINRQVRELPQWLAKALPPEIIT
jgi:predicted ABC-type ATPase